MAWRMTFGFSLRAAALVAVMCAAPTGVSAAGQPVPAVPAPQGTKLGLTVEALDPVIAERVHVPPVTRGLVVTSLAFKGPAADAGIKIGDIIQALDGKPLAGAKGVKTLADHHGPAQLTVLRAGVTSVVPVG